MYCIFICVYVHMCAYLNVQTYICSYTYVYLNAYICTYIHTHIFTFYKKEETLRIAGMDQHQSAHLAHLSSGLLAWTVPRSLEGSRK